MRKPSWLGLTTVAAGLAIAPAFAQDMPTIDTEDADLGSMEVGDGRLHPTVTLDLRNGDFVRGGYDDDAADLGRLPVHLQVGVGYELRRDAAGEPDAWIVLRSSNGFHAPIAGERTSPRAWYESNNLAGLVVEPAKGLRVGASYTVKTSPNGVSATTHEVSATASYQAETGLGVLHPSFAATVRPKGDGGLYTAAGIEPEFALAAGEDAPSIGIPALIGIGWGGFQGEGSGDRLFGSVGLAYSHPFAVGATRWRFRAEGLALIRDDRLRALSGPRGETGTVVPLATISVAVAY